MRVCAVNDPACVCVCVEGTQGFCRWSRALSHKLLPPSLLPPLSLSPPLSSLPPSFPAVSSPCLPTLHASQFFAFSFLHNITNFNTTSGFHASFHSRYDNLRETTFPPLFRPRPVTFSAVSLRRALAVKQGTKKHTPEAGERIQ